MIERDLLDEGGSVSAIVPPLEDQDQPGDEGAGPGEGHVELGGQGGQEHGRHPEILTYFKRSTQIKYYKCNLQQSE